MNKVYNLWFEWLSQADRMCAELNSIDVESGEKWIPMPLNQYIGVDLISDNQYAVKLNTDVKDIIEAMGENNGYCPCMIKQTEDTLCCCKAFRNKESGTCHCGIFSK